MRIQHNIMAMSAYRNYTNNVSAMQKNLEKLSSGYKINRAGDDAAGLAISEKMRAQITGLETAQKNAKDGISLVQTAEGALTEVHDMLNRMVELATQSANGTYDDTTDRYQLQKEVNQLLEEIDRIADSSNFNGINLLDGTLGLNTDAFSLASVSAVSASDGTIDISDLVAAESDGSPAVHLEVAGNSTEVAPGATIDLGDIKFKDVAAGDTVSIDFTIGDISITVDVTNTGSATADLDATSVAAALKDALAASTYGVSTDDGIHNSTTASNTGLRIGDAVYTVGGSGSAITLTFAGFGTGATYKETADGNFSTDQAADFNADLGFDVSVSSDDGMEGDVIHKATNVTFAKAITPTTKAGIDINLEDVVVNGGQLTIDGQTFVFQTDANNAPTVPTGGVTIDVSGYDEDDWVHAAADLLSKQTITGADSRTWSIGVNGDGTTIHIDQTAGSAPGKALDTYDKLVGVISAKGPAVTAANAGTSITITPDKVAEGNTLNIDGVKYVFTKDLTGKTDDDKTKYVQFSEGGKDAAANLQAKIGSATSSVSGNVVTVRAASATADAPVVLGKGLTLQIGDTSDSYNQLNVAVQDCHASSLGIGGLDISTEEAAQAAIAKIKSAINYVSDVRGTLGATQNRLDHTINNLSVMTENIQDAESTIRDVDVAEEMMAYTKNNILIQSAQAMLAQANQVPQGVLQLLQ